MSELQLSDPAPAPVLDVSGLSVSFRTSDGMVNAVRGIDFDLRAGECLGIVGESGSGKSQTALAIMGLLADNGETSGSIRFAGEDVLGASAKVMRRLRGAEMSMVFQDPLTSLTPIACREAVAP